MRIISIYSIVPVILIPLNKEETFFEATILNNHFKWSFLSIYIS